MSRVPWLTSAWPIACAAFVSTACSAPTTCRTDAWSEGAASVASQRLSGSALLSNTGEAESFDLDVSLTDLPALWPSRSAIKNADVGVSIALAYTKPPLGGDGLTEMPRLQVRIGRETGITTSTFSNGSERTGRQLFEDCATGDEYCCAFGSEQCQARLHFTVERLDGAPFPPVQVTWTAGADATIDSCPKDFSSPTLSLTSEAP
jgi:hypothetical protein